MTGLIGLCSTLAALNSFDNACFKELQPSVDFVTIDKQFGAAFICLVVATVLKVVDIVAHVVVPVPQEGFWVPGAAVGSSGKVQNGVHESSDKCSAVEVHEFSAIPVPSAVEEVAGVVAAR